VKYQTPYGKVRSGWKVKNGKLIVDAEIPANTTATIYMPVSNADIVFESGRKVSSVKDIQVCNGGNGYVQMTVGSGKYSFITDWIGNVQN
jgi:alpha-L-rhamnosidase